MLRYWNYSDILKEQETARKTIGALERRVQELNAELAELKAQAQDTPRVSERYVVRESSLDLIVGHPIWQIHDIKKNCVHNAWIINRAEAIEEAARLNSEGA